MMKRERTRVCVSAERDVSQISRDGILLRVRRKTRGGQFGRRRERPTIVRTREFLRRRALQCPRLTCSMNSAARRATTEIRAFLDDFANFCAQKTRKTGEKTGRKRTRKKKTAMTGVSMCCCCTNDLYFRSCKTVSNTGVKTSGGSQVC